MFRSSRGLIACAASIAACCAAAPAWADIARPPGANPAGRGYELVSLPDSGATEIFIGSPEDRSTLYRPPFVARSGGVALTYTAFAVPGQPTRSGIAAFRSVRQASGVWTQSFAGIPKPGGLFDTPNAWTPDFSTVLWDADGPAGARTPDGTERRRQVLSADARTVTYVQNDAPRIGNDLDEFNLYQRGGDGVSRRVNVTSGGQPLVYTDLNGVAQPDGARIAFSSDDESGSGQALYLREGGTTTRVDTGPSAPSARTNTEYVGASTDLRTILFVTRDRLLAADTDDDADLYRWTDGGGALQLVSRGTGSGGNSSACGSSLPAAQVNDSPQGCDVAFAGASKDGQLVYFLSPERLDGASGAEQDGVNLYARSGTGAIQYVLSLDRDDPAALDRAALTQLNLISLERQISVEDDGSVLVRTLRKPGTQDSYDQLQIVRAVPGSAGAACVSCGASGSSSELSRLSTNNGAFRQNATGDGQHVFFDSQARLVADDRNSTWDVYDYDVASGSRTLVSAGTSGNPSQFEGVSADGADVMFSTADTLVGLDQNGPVRKVYDARRGGGQEPPAVGTTTPCGDACDPPGPAAPPFDLPANGAFGTSTGNVRQAAAVRVALGAVSASQRRSAARTGRLALTVRTSAKARVRISGRAKLGRSTATVASGTVTLSKAGSKRVTLRLSSAARRTLKSKGSLKVSFSARVVGGPASKTVSVSLRATSKTKAGTR